jgi:dTDP-4-dehydrorhamnose 3,5-epimerase
VRFEQAPIPGVWIVEAERSADERGFFARTIDASVFERHGLVGTFPQHSIAFNDRRGTLRGLHYQIGVYAEEKIVRCTRGAAFDVVVDLRRRSSAFGRWMWLRIDEQNRQALYIPAGCAHGYQTLEDGTELLYAISKPYEARAARGIHYADTALNITWPLEVTALSARDAALPRLADAELP